MDNSILVEVFESSHDLVHVADGFYLSESFPSFDEIIKALVRTELQKNVDVILVLEKVFKSDDTLMFHTSVDFDFTH